MLKSISKILFSLGAIAVATVGQVSGDDRYTPRLHYFVVSGPSHGIGIKHTFQRASFAQLYGQVAAVLYQRLSK